MDRFRQLAALRDRRNRGINMLRGAAGDFGPLHMPRFNPFIKPYAKSSLEFWRDDKWVDATNMAGFIERENGRNGGRHLRRFADTHLAYEAKKHGTTPKKELTRTAHGYSLMEGVIDDALLGDLVRGTCLSTPQTSMSSAATSALTRATSSTKRSNISKIQSGGAAAWNEATSENIHELLLALFNQFPLTISKHTFHHADERVDFEGIWAGAGGRRTKFQKLCRAKFCHLARTTYLFRFRRIFKKDMDQAYGDHMETAGITDLQIPPIAMMPSRPTAGAGTGRGIKSLVQHVKDYSFDEEHEVLPV